ncbi:Glycosyltransferase Family 31 protein [Trametes cinnabarina]|uniref:Glycosyltransferase Family 31 protein n=1 Tax=Pycnoporus cinnabarinus TaxID=5643 RepID=A0A060SBI8_PYCCI|nr:Glycosyltransferase Family 31 protein [Trametes cinnabarina]
MIRIQLPPPPSSTIEIRTTPLTPSWTHPLPHTKRRSSTPLHLRARQTIPCSTPHATSTLPIDTRPLPPPPSAPRRRTPPSPHARLPLSPFTTLARPRAAQTLRASQTHRPSTDPPDSRYGARTSPAGGGSSASVPMLQIIGGVGEDGETSSGGSGAASASSGGSSAIHSFQRLPSPFLLTLLFLTIFGVSLTFLLIYILNPDKEPLPWRGYCTLPQHSGGPPSPSLSPTALLQTPLPTNLTPSVFPPPDFDAMAPAGVFIGVFSMDTAVERRMLVRSTWANHVRSREGAGDGDGGIGTSRTVVRFILGQPRKDWERRVRLEMETYNDMVILPVQENMNSGKSHAFFSWAANHSWVPPLYQDNFTRMPEEFSYMNVSHPAPVLASHDPALAHQDRLKSTEPRPWVRPDFVVKADDDSFVMLAELEARLRVELYKDPIPPPPPPSDRKQPTSQQSHFRARSDDEPAILDFDQIASYFDFALPSYATRPPSTLTATPPAVPEEPPSRDPLVFWGYLVKNRFMAGELYALSFALVDWVAKDPLVKTMVRGAEDKQTSKWIRAHPRAEQVRWSSERCWIYDHPRAGTVYVILLFAHRSETNRYSHGFLFPSEVRRVQEGVMRDVQRLAQQLAKETSSTAAPAAVPPGQNVPSPEKWSHSTVSKFGSRYSPPSGDLSLDYSVEALVEGSDMSMVHDDGSMSADLAWKYREGRRKRYEGQRVGGTVVVHFIKKNMWFLETAAALLHGEDVTPLERAMDRAQEVPETTRASSEELSAESAFHEDLRDSDTVDSEDGASANSDRIQVQSRGARTMARRRNGEPEGSEAR